MPAPEKHPISISEEEAALYDRQIRLWGLEAQNKLKNARVLLYGMTPLGAEIAKNIVLAGISHLAVYDKHNVSQSDVMLNFLIPSDSIGEKRSTASIKRLQLLNPLVQITSFETNQEAFGSFDIIVVSAESFEENLSMWNSVWDSFRQSPDAKPQLILAFTCSLYGFVFYDLGAHYYISEETTTKKPGKPDAYSKVIVLSKKVAYYPTLDECLDMCQEKRISSTKPATWSKTLPKGYFIMQVLRRLSPDSFPLSLENLQSKWSEVAAELDVDECLLSEQDLECCCGPQSPSVNAVLGGILSQEIIRAITRKGEPPGNWCFFNGIQCSAVVDWLPRDSVRIENAQ